MKLTVEMVRAAVLGLTAAVVLGAASLGLGSLSAHAEPKDADAFSCFTTDAQGIAGIYVAEEEISIPNGDGTETVFRCDGRTGQWQQVSMIVVSVDS